MDGTVLQNLIILMSLARNDYNILRLSELNGPENRRPAIRNLFMLLIAKGFPNPRLDLGKNEFRIFRARVV